MSPLLNTLYSAWPFQELKSHYRSHLNVDDIRVVVKKQKNKTCSKATLLLSQVAGVIRSNKKGRPEIVCRVTVVL